MALQAKLADRRMCAMLDAARFRAEQSSAYAERERPMRRLGSE